MSLSITNKSEVPLLSRTVITASLPYTGVTPSKSDILNQLASTLKSDQKLVVLKSIRTGFGNHTAKITAYLYDTEENLHMVEPKLHKKQVEKLKKLAEKSKENPADPKKEEKIPTEEEKPAEPNDNKSPIDDKREETKE